MYTAEGNVDSIAHAGTVIPVRYVPRMRKQSLCQFPLLTIRSNDKDRDAK
jgi:hypothetical protein